jgi:hypothetical protein
LSSGTAFFGVFFRVLGEVFFVGRDGSAFLSADYADFVRPVLGIRRAFVQGREADRRF